MKLTASRSLRYFAILGILLFVSAPSYGQESKPRVAVKAPTIGEGVKKRVQKYLNLSTIYDELEAALLAVGQFELVTRDKRKLKSLLDEQDLGKSNRFKGNAAAVGQLENANYIVIPVVRDFKFNRSSIPVPNISSKYRRQDSGMLEISAQILDTETGGIKATFSLNDSFATKRQIVNSKRGSPSSVHFTRMAKNVAAKMADQLVDTVFPMVVLQTNGRLVFINRGQGGGLKVGSFLNIYRPGEQLIDPYSKEVLGTTEELVGQVKITRINPKFTIAEIVQKGLKQPVMAKDILRKPQK